MASRRSPRGLSDRGLRGEHGGRAAAWEMIRVSDAQPLNPPQSPFLSPVRRRRRTAFPLGRRIGVAVFSASVSRQARLRMTQPSPSPRKTMTQPGLRLCRSPPAAALFAVRCRGDQMIIDAILLEPFQRQDCASSRAAAHTPARSLAVDRRPCVLLVLHQVVQQEDKVWSFSRWPCWPIAAHFRSGIALRHRGQLRQQSCRTPGLAHRGSALPQAAMRRT